MSRVVLLLLAAGCLALALATHLEMLDPGAGWPSGWTRAHPDPRDLGEVGEASHVAERAEAWRRDVSLLALGLGVACLAGALRRGARAFGDATHDAIHDATHGGGHDGGHDATRGAARPGDVPGAWPLAVGSLAVGLVALVGSAQDVSARAGRGAWTLGDDGLRAVAGPHTASVRAWRERVPEDAAVLVVGTRDFLLNLVAWSLHPRAIHPLVVPLPADMRAAALVELARDVEAGRDAPGGRWLVDLDALAGAADRPALQRVDGP